MPNQNVSPARREALVSVAQAATLLGVHPNTVRAWTDAGRLPAYRINARGDRRFRRTDVERLLQEGDAPRPAELADPSFVHRDASIAALGRLARAGASSANPTAVSRLAVETLRSQLAIPRVAVYVLRGDDLVLESHGGHASTPPLILDATDAENVPGRLRLPLVAGSSIVGAIVVEDLPAGADHAFLRTLAGVIGTALHGAQLLSRLRRELRRARALRGVITELSGQLDLSEVLQEVVQRTRGLFEADRAGLWLVGESRHPFQLAADYGLSEKFLEGTARLTLVSDTLGVRAVRERRPVFRTRIIRGQGIGVLGDAYAEEGIRTACMVPLVADDRAVGLLGLYHDADRAWPEDELTLVQAFANQAAIAISNARLYHSVAQQAARMRSIQDLSTRLNRLNEVRAIGQAIVDEASTLAEYHDIRVYAVDRAQNTCEPIAFTKQMLGDGGDYEQRLRVSVGEGFTGWVAEHGEPLLIDNALDDPRGKTIDDTDDIEESMLVVPMIFESTVLGVIVLSQLGFGRFTPDDLQTMTIFAGYAAQALSNATAYERLAEQSDELARQLESQRRLLEINERLLSALDPSEVFQTIADSLHAVVHYDNLSIYRADREARELRPVLTRERYADEVSRYIIPFGRGLMGWVVEHGEPVLANEALKDPRVVQIPGTPEDPEALVVVPLVFGGEVIGAMNVSRIGDDEVGFSQADFELVKLFAGQASIAMRNADAHHAVSQRADTDALTGMGNHGAFQRALAAALESAAPDASVGLLMMDLDRFKSYNDALGHPAGDRLLHAIATAIYGAARSEDRVFRYGGDEFALILPGIDTAGAERVAQRVRRAVAGITEGAQQAVTITVGVAMYPHDATDKNDLIAAADTALYFGKQAGEDRLVRVDDLPAEVRTLRGRLDELARAALRHPSEAGHVEELVEHAMRGGGESDDAMRATLLALARSLSTRDSRTRGHGDRVGRLARQVALELGCDDATAGAVELGARLHDVDRDDPLRGIRLVDDVVGWEHAAGDEERPAPREGVAGQIVAAAHAYDMRTAEGGKRGGRREALAAIRERDDLTPAVVSALERVVGATSRPAGHRRLADEVSGAA